MTLGRRRFLGTGAAAALAAALAPHWAAAPPGRRIVSLCVSDAQWRTAQPRGI